MKIITTEQMIDRFKIIHLDKYDYSKFVYTGFSSTGIIICKTHGEFIQTPQVHLDGSGCQLCGRDISTNHKRDTKQIFINKANKLHNNKYDYSKFNYVNDYTKGTIICPIHGEFAQAPKHHKTNTGCWECVKINIANSMKCSNQDFIIRCNKIHDNKYNYSKFNYVNNYTKGTIICPKHGEFFQTPSNHVCGRGCPHCKSSKGENAIRNILKENSINYICQYKFIDCRGEKYCLPFDFYLVDLNIAIEFQGMQHFISCNHFGGDKKLEYTKRYDNIKKQYCLTHGIKLVEIRYDDNIDECITQHVLNKI